MPTRARRPRHAGILQRAYTVANRGDTVQMAGGNYGAQTLSYLSAKDSGSGVVTFAPASGATVTFGDLTSSELTARQNHR